MKLVINYIIFFSALFICYSCGAPKAGLKNEEVWLPANFNPKTSTLLIEATTTKSKGIEVWTEQIKKRYPYKFRVIPMGTKVGEGTRFSDTTKYKYLVQCQLTTGYRQISGDVMSRNTGYTRDWRFVDIIEKKEYPYTKVNAQGQLTTLVMIFNTIKKKHNYKK